MEGPLSSPNLEGLDAFSFQPDRVEKPWGYELIWAKAEDYAGKLLAFRHEGLWLTVNTPKDLRRAEEYVSSHPEWLQA